MSTAGRRKEKSGVAAASIRPHFSNVPQTYFSTGTLSRIIFLSAHLLNPAPMRRGFSADFGSSFGQLTM